MGHALDLPLRWGRELLEGRGFGLAAQTQKPALPHVVVYKTPTCGCCSNWVAHMRQHGFTVEAHDVSQARLSQMGGDAGITQALASCHTAKVDGYFVEWVFTDAGEPGTKDKVLLLRVWPPDFSAVLFELVDKSLTFGNQQAHKTNGKSK